MSIRLKTVLIVLPLIIASVLISGIASSLSARSGITRVTIEFLGFKAQELEKYLRSQWELLVANELQDQPAYIEAARKAGLSFARSLVRSESELILALNHDAQVVMQTGEIVVTEADQKLFREMIQTYGWQEFTLAGKGRVGQSFYFAPLDWYCLITEEEETFFGEVKQIRVQNGIILTVACVVSLFLLLVFSGYLTRPLTKMVAAMKDIITYNDLSERVSVEFRDEIGVLANTFNIMIGELDTAYSQIKNYAFKAVVAKKQEQEIRNIFQKYVPKDVIDSCLQNPVAMLGGNDRVVAVLFSDIRKFTSISEGMKPEDLVGSLNRYFTIMVDIVMRHRGVVDKYIGDAIMAFYGAPTRHEDDALQAVLSALEMNEALAQFNTQQVKLGKPRFKIGIGINYGEVTVGNIGSERKMDYTVIGDMVNLASRLESLTKHYRQDLIFSKTVQIEISKTLPCRLLDRVKVRGKEQSEQIYTTQRRLDENERRGWDCHHEALAFYFESRFDEALPLFAQVQSYLPGDPVSTLFADRCRTYLNHPPPEDWKGVYSMESG